MNEWIAKHIGHVVLATATLTVVLAGLTVWLVSRESSVERKIPVVQQIGSPCRSAFAKGGLEAVRTDEQCTLQARLIFTNLCDHHPIIPACQVLNTKGVVTHNGNTKAPSQQPGPSGGLKHSHKAPETPSQPVSPPRTHVPLGPLESPACSVTAALNVPVCH